MLKRTVYLKYTLVYFKMVCFPSPCQRPKGIFSNICYGNLMEHLEVNITVFCRLPKTSPGDFNSRSCPYWTSSNCLLHFRLSYPSTGSQNSFCLWVLALVSLDDLYSPASLSSLGGSNLPCVFPSLWMQEVLILQSV